MANWLEGPWKFEFPQAPGFCPLRSVGRVGGCVQGRGALLALGGGRFMPTGS